MNDLAPAASPLHFECPTCGAISGSLCQHKVEAIAKDAQNAARWRWARDILAGDDRDIVNTKTLFVGAGLMRGESIEQIVDAGIGAIP